MRIKIILTVILILSVLFAGSCATAKKNDPLLKNPKEYVPDTGSGTEFVYEFDVVVAVDPEEQQAPRPDYEEEYKPRPQPKPDEPPAPAFFESIYVPVSESGSNSASEQQRAQQLEAERLAQQQEADRLALLAQQEEAQRLSQQKQQEEERLAQQRRQEEERLSKQQASMSGSSPAAGRNTNVIGSGSLNVEGVVDYIKFKNKNPALSEANTRRLIGLYVDEAAKEDVNYDFAIAQMLYWTAFLTDKQRVETNNFAGLQPTKDWNGRFPTMAEGVQAHIQHLRGYSHPTLKDPGTKIVDPRWNQISNFRGTVKSFDQLYAKWTQNTDRYKRNINLILNDLYQYSDKKR